MAPVVKQEFGKSTFMVSQRKYQFLANSLGGHPLPSRVIEGQTLLWWLPTDIYQCATGVG
jgi:hypothetical protein